MMLLFPDGRSKALTLSYDDGVEQDERLIRILDRHGLKCTFNLNSGLWAPEGTRWPQGQIHRRLTGQRAKQLYPGSGHEIAVHCLTHAALAGLSLPRAVHEILEDRLNLERMAGTLVRGAAYPYGAYDENAVRALEDCGIVYCRTVQSTHAFALPPRPLTLHPTCHHDDPLLEELCSRFLSDDGRKEPRLFYLWGHAYEFEANDNWQVIERFAEKMGGREEIWYCTNIEVIDYVSAFRSLRFSADGRTVLNPTAYTLWFADGKNQGKIAPGETLRL